MTEFEAKINATLSRGCIATCHEFRDGVRTGRKLTIEVNKLSRENDRDSQFVFRNLGCTVRVDHDFFDNC